MEVMAKYYVVCTAVVCVCVQVYGSPTVACGIGSERAG